MKNIMGKKDIEIKKIARKNAINIKIMTIIECYFKVFKALYNSIQKKIAIEVWFLIITSIIAFQKM